MNVVWVVSRTPSTEMGQPTPSNVFSNEDVAKRQARAYEDAGWQVVVTRYEVKEEMTEAAKSLR